MKSNDNARHRRRGTIRTLSPPRLLRRGLLACGAATCLLATAPAQVTFSIDWHGPLRSVPDAGFLFPITEGDVLVPVPGMPVLAAPIPPMIFNSAGVAGPAFPGLTLITHPVPCVGMPPGVACPVEVDAISYGRDRRLVPGEPPGVIFFSTDEYASGWTGPAPPLPPPNILSEGPLPGVFDSAADAWTDLGLPPMPVLPFVLGGPVIGHVGVVDGNGLPSASGFVYPGVGLVEPGPLTFSPVDPGSNMDAMVIGPPIPIPVYFSLDTPFPDPLTGPREGTGPPNGAFCSDVLTNTGGGPPVVWAPAFLLGLDLFGPNTDDLDALILWENGSGVFERSSAPYDWLGGGTDMLLFSVRRGSALVMLGIPDSIWGVPIEEGDILTTPPAPGMPPGIVYPAAALGLASARTGFPNAVVGPPWSDDLNALSAPPFPLFDCNGNGLEDAVDIALGISPDCQPNGIPDECERLVTPYCFGVGCPCGNDFPPPAGCRNNLGVGALFTASGTTSVTCDDLVFTTTGLPAFNFGLYYMGNGIMNAPFGNGLRCVAGALQRFPVQNTGPAGMLVRGPGIAAFTCATFPPMFCITPGLTWNFQAWYRDPGGPCGSSFNFSNAITATFLP
jgi:hypothetical protein